MNNCLYFPIAYTQVHHYNKHIALAGVYINARIRVALIYYRLDCLGTECHNSHILDGSPHISHRRN